MSHRLFNFVIGAFALFVWIQSGVASEKATLVGPWRPEAAIVAPPVPMFQAPWLSFNTALNSTSGSPIALATGDLDGDGDIDVVVPRAYAAGGFAFLRNEGGGKFAAPVAYAGTGRAAGIALADLDGDGDLDVAVTDSDALTVGNTVSVYLNDGTGNFGARQAVSVGTGAVVPVGIVAGDFDGDGDKDLAVAAFRYSGGGSNVVLLRNNGNGTFAAPVVLPTAAAPYDIAAADLNGDGHPDLVVGHDASKVTVLINNGAGSFAPAITYAGLGPESGNAFPAVSLADVDRDGDIDVFYGSTATSDGTTGHIVQLRNNGAGQLTRDADIPLVIYSVGPADLTAADLNGDGAVDLVAASYDGRSSDGVYVILNNGTGGFGNAVLYPAGQITAAVAAADLNGDGKVDVLTADSYSNAVTVRFNPGTGVFPTQTDDYAEFIQSFMDAADIDGDGDLDIFTSGPHPSASSGAILRNDGTGRFLNRTTINNNNGLDGVAAGVLRDLNGDGKPDLLFNNANTSSQYDFFTAKNNGNGTFAAPVRWVVGSAGWGEVDAFDLDGDGDLDVVDMEAEGAPSIPDGRFFIAMNNGNGTFQVPFSYDLLPGRPEDVVAGDFNRDGKLDLAMTNNGAYGFDSRVFVVLGNGNGTFGAPIVYTVGRGPLYLVTADFDRDGNLDLATVNSGYNNEGNEGVTLLFGTGTGTFNRLTNYYAPFSPDLLGASGIAAGDIDRDGDIDLVTTGVSNDVAIYVNNGAGGFSFPYRLGAFAGTHWPLLRDFTCDGTVDLAVLSARPALGFDSGVGVLRGVAAVPLATTSVVSRKTHSTAGIFDIALPLSGASGIESRGGAHTIVATFSNPITAGTASVSSGTGAVSGTAISGNTLTVTLSGVADRQVITITFNGVMDSSGQTLPPTSVSMNLLLGDVNGNGLVNASDVSQTKANVGVALSSTNFRADVNLSGAVNSSDVGAVKAASGGL